MQNNAKRLRFSTARAGIEFPSSPSLRIYNGSRRCFDRVVYLSADIACVSGGCGWICLLFNHARRLNAFMQMQKTFAGIKPYCDVCNPITQTMRLLRPETTRPVHIFLPSRIVATTVSKQDR